MGCIECSYEEKETFFYYLVYSLGCVPIIKLQMVRSTSTNLLLPGDRRSSIQIIADVLKLLRLGEAGITEITYTLKMSHEMTRRYLNELLERGLISRLIENRLASYQVTEKGLKLLMEIENMQEILNQEETLDILSAPQLIKPFHKRRRV